MSLYSSLFNLGSHFQLNFTINSAEILESLKEFESEWKVYNPSKKGCNRFGLSLISLDGELTGYPDLLSVRDYNETAAIKLNEMSFKKPTLAMKALDKTSLSTLLSKFDKSLGRSHLIKLGRGGFFPPHRDSVSLNPSVFRIIIFLKNCNSHNFVFLLGDQRINVWDESVWVVNTMISHAVFSFLNEAKFIVLNVECTEEAIHKVFESLLTY